MNQTLASIFIREQVIDAIREFFKHDGFHEIITPVLNQGLPLEPNLYSFSTEWQYLDRQQTLYLPTSPEAGLKKMLALGLEKVFAISPSFRNQEPADQEHNPEFLMLEWYRSNADYQQIMVDVEELIHFVAKKLATVKRQQLKYQEEIINLTTPWKRVSLAELFFKEINQPIANFLRLSEMQSLAKKLGYQTQNSTWEQLFNQVFIELLEPQLGKQPVFLIDFPARISPLCKPKPDQLFLAQRFEVYLAGMELGNGNTEETKVEKVQGYFQKEQDFRVKNKLSIPKIDQQFLQALKRLDQTNKNYAGIGLGVERLAMILANESEIKTINPFALKS